MAGTSDYHHIPYVLDVITQVNPKRVLDVGVGFGRWGVLCREVLEVWQERFHRDIWKVRLDGIEIFEPYHNPLWNAVYDRVYFGDASSLLDTLGHYDLILCGDVIEHYEKSRGRQCLDKMLAHAEFVILTSPSTHWPQGPQCGNAHECHRSEWTAADFVEIPHRYQDCGNTFVAVLARDPTRLQDIVLSHPLHNLGVRRGSRELIRLLIRHLGRQFT